MRVVSEYQLPVKLTTFDFLVFIPLLYSAWSKHHLITLWSRTRRDHDAGKSLQQKRSPSRTRDFWVPLLPRGISKEPIGVNRYYHAYLIWIIALPPPFFQSYAYISSSLSWVKCSDQAEKIIIIKLEIKPIRWFVPLIASSVRAFILKS
jgi:hypothetical protein